MTATAQRSVGPGGGRAAQAGDRRAALLLHAMPEVDRAWLLDQLLDPERHALRELLRELGELGIPSDRSLLDRSVAGAVPGRACADGAAGGARDEDRAAIVEADPAAVAELLRHEPATLAAYALRLGDPAWRAAVLRQRTALARAAVDRELGRVRRAPALEAAVARAVAARLEPARRAAATRVGRSWHAWLRRIGRRP